MGMDEIADNEALADLVLRYYHNPEIIPREIYLSFPLETEIAAAVAEILSQHAGHTVSHHTPQKAKTKSCAKWRFKMR